MLEIGFKTNIGKVRTQNEDAFYILPEKKVYIVADGVGGNSGGEIASRTAVYEITQYINNNRLPENSDAIIIRDYLDEAIRKANAVIYKKAKEDDLNKMMATTVVMCLLNGDYAYIAHAGDSRAYIIRQGKILQITKDHTYVNALLDAGVITKAQAENHEKKHVITKALGAEIDIKPDYKQVSIKEGDVLLLCSDGLFGEVSDSLIATVAGDKSLSMRQITSNLVDMANEAGGRDNITVIGIRI